MTHYLLTIEQADGEVNIGSGVSEKYVDTKINELNNKIDTKTTMDEVKDVLSDQYTSKITFDSTLSGYTTTNDLKENILTNYAKTSITDNINNTLTSSTSISPGHKHQISDIIDLSTKITSIDESITDIQSKKSDLTYVDSELEKKYSIDYVPVDVSSAISETTIENIGENTDVEKLYFIITITFINNDYIPQFPSEQTELCNFNLSFLKNSTTNYTIKPSIKIQNKNNENYITATWVNIVDFDIQSGKLIINCYYDWPGNVLTFSKISEITYQSSALLKYTYHKKNIICDIINGNDIVQVDHTHTLSDITDYTAPDLSTKADSTHTHTLSDITDYTAIDLSTKANTVHTHTLSDITDYTAPDLSNYALADHTHLNYEVAGDINQITTFNISSAYIEHVKNTATEDDIIIIGLRTAEVEKEVISTVIENNNAITTINDTTVLNDVIINGSLQNNGSQTITHLTSSSESLVIGTFCETDGTIYDKFKDNVQPTDCICNIKQSTKLNKNIIGITVSTDPIKFATHGDVLIKVVNDTYNVGDILVPGQGGYGKKPTSDELMTCLLNKIPTAKITSLETGIDNEVACIML